MSSKTNKTWQDIVEANYVTSKKYPAQKSDGTAYLGKAQMYLESGVWCDKYHAKMAGLEIDEATKRQVPKSRAGYSTLYKVKTERPPQKKGGLQLLLRQLQIYTGKKGTGKTEAQKAESLLKAIKKDLTKEESVALNHYLRNFFSVIVVEDKKIPLEKIGKAASIGYSIVTAEKTGGKK